MCAGAAVCAMPSRESQKVGLIGQSGACLHAHGQSNRNAQEGAKGVIAGPPSHPALKSNAILMGPPACDIGSRRIFLSKTSHIPPDRRRCFYLALLSSHKNSPDFAAFLKIAIPTLRMTLRGSQNASQFLQPVCNATAAALRLCHTWSDGEGSKSCHRRCD